MTQRQAPEIKAFLEDYAALCKRHGLAFGHEDAHGGFIVERYTDYLIEWALSAAVAPDALRE